MCAGLPFCLARHARRSSILLGVVWVACAEVFPLARCGIRGGVPFCLARPGMRGSVPFCLAWPGVRSGVPFCLAWHRCSILSGADRCARRSSILHGAARAGFFYSARRGMHGGLRLRPVWYARRCSVLSGVARYARRCSILPGAV